MLESRVLRSAAPVPDPRIDAAEGGDPADPRGDVAGGKVVVLVANLSRRAIGHLRISTMRQLRRKSSAVVLGNSVNSNRNPNPNPNKTQTNVNTEPGSMANLTPEQSVRLEHIRAAHVDGIEPCRALPDLRLPAEHPASAVPEAAAGDRSLVDANSADGENVMARAGGVRAQLLRGKDYFGLTGRDLEGDPRDHKKGDLNGPVEARTGSPSTAL